MTVDQSLLDLLSIQMGCMYLSDLRFLSPEQRRYLARAGVADTPAGGHPGVERRAGLPDRRAAGAHSPGRKGPACSLVISALRRRDR